MLKQRIFFGVLMIIAIVALLAADGYLAWRFADVPCDDYRACLARGGITTALIVVLVQLAIGEFLTLANLAGYRPLTVWPRLVAAGLVLLPWLTWNRLLPDLTRFPADLSPATGLLIVGIAGTVITMVLRRQTDRALANLAISILPIVYLGYFASFVVRLRCDFPTAAGAYWVFYYILVTKFTDIGGYLIGRKIGKTKLIPAVSPGKSVEGLCAGIGGAVLVAAAFGRLAPTFVQSSQALSFPQILVFAVLMAILGQFGDLAVSLIKRDVGRKDSGDAVPSFGGYLDIVDSPVLTAPMAWWLLTNWQPLG